MGKMIDMGVMPKKNDMMEVQNSGSQEKPKKRYPSFSIDPSVMKELRGKNLGDTCTLEIVVEITGMEENEYRSAIELKIVRGKYGRDGADEEMTASDKRNKIKKMYDTSSSEDDDE